jgi:hypothetical protein
MTEHQISVIRRHIKENPTVESNIALARIIEKKSKLGLSVGSLQKYISKVKAIPANVVETKAKSLIKGDIPKVKIKKETKGCPTAHKIYFSYSHIKDLDLVNHIDTVLKDNGIHNKECSSLFDISEDLNNELTAYGVIITEVEPKIEVGSEIVFDAFEKSSYIVALKDPSHYTPVDEPVKFDTVIDIHEYSHLYQGFLDLLSLAVPTEAVANHDVKLYIDVKFHTPGTSNISIEDARFYLAHFRDSFNAKVILVVDQDDFDLLNSFKGFVIDEVKFRILEEEFDEEFEEEFDEQDEE